MQDNDMDKKEQKITFAEWLNIFSEMGEDRFGLLSADPRIAHEYYKSGYSPKESLDQSAREFDEWILDIKKEIKEIPHVE